jgi:hypothetical protein
MYYNLAATTAENAAKARESLAKTMTREEIADAQRLSRDWKPTAPAK